MIQPGRTIGIFGGGQLGRMSGIAARRMGFGLSIFEPAPACPAAAVADRVFTAPYEDEEALESFLKSADVLTYEFENIPASTVRFAAARRALHPSAEILHICQNREREKNFLRRAGIPHAPFQVVANAAELTRALETIGFPCVLKTADFGYDGKGQIKIPAPPDDPEALWKEFNAPRGVLEAWIPFERELSVIVARNPQGQTAVFPLSENIHTDHILDLSIVPARVDAGIARDTVELARTIADALDLTGLLAVELFQTETGALLVNELAPRPHNSGHFTFDACVTSQFEQHVRSVCGLPLGSTDLLRPVVMVNILGQAWSRGEPNWSVLLAEPGLKLHLYGKGEARTGRKMGHFSVLAESVDLALKKALSLRPVVFPAARPPHEHSPASSIHS
ncbi:MAG: 5-(carboxyamino)imidazole ribonucleotide synthase [Opitutaceae bacterium]